MHTLFPPLPLSQIPYPFPHSIFLRRVSYIGAGLEHIQHLWIKNLLPTYEVKLSWIWSLHCMQQGPPTLFAWSNDNLGASFLSNSNDRKFQVST